MRLKSLVGLAAIMVALWVMSGVNRDRFHRDVYTLCIGLAGDGPVVTEEELGNCVCKADAAITAMTWKSRLPQSMIRLTDAENEQIVTAQAECKGAPGPVSWYRLPGSNGGPLDPQSSALTN